jgi:hypothetical protein
MASGGSDRAPGGSKSSSGAQNLAPKANPGPGGARECDPGAGFSQNRAPGLKIQPPGPIPAPEGPGSVTQGLDFGSAPGGPIRASRGPDPCADCCSGRGDIHLWYVGSAEAGPTRPVRHPKGSRLDFQPRNRPDLKARPFHFQTYLMLDPLTVAFLSLLSGRGRGFAWAGAFEEEKKTMTMTKIIGFSGSLGRSPGRSPSTSG